MSRNTRTKKDRNQVKATHRSFNAAFLFFIRILTLFATAFIYLWMMSFVYPFMLLATRTMGISLAAYIVVYVIMTRVYGGMDIGIKKSQPIVFALGLTVFFADLAAHLFLSIMNVTVVHDGKFVFETPGRLILIYLIQLIVIIVFTYAGNDIYFVVNKPLDCLVVTKSGAGHKRILRELGNYRKQYRVIGVISYLNPAVAERIEEADLVFFYGLSDAERSDLVEYCYELRKDISYSVEMTDIVGMRGQYMNYNDQTFLSSPEKHLTIEEQFIKRTMDLIVSVIGLILTSPIFLITALAIKFEDGGPVFYKQSRATIGGRDFKVLKFRSMRQEVGGIHKSVQAGDDRITKVGRFIRKFRIDELPQLVNVLMGDMSLVGPRPEMLENVDKYTLEMPQFAYRQKMKAGLTGMAQVYGRYNTSPKDKLIMDLTYIETYSLWLDLVLLFRTVLVLLTPEESTEAFKEDDPAEDIVE